MRPLDPRRAQERFTSALHDERVAAILGVALGVTFSVCFATGLWSHLVQSPPSWFSRPPRPAGLYRITQGVHVATGLATIPLLLAKLWVVYPKLFAWPPFRSFAVAVERVALLPLIAGGLFLVGTGLANINLWYPWPFSFRTAHYWAAWITIGALFVHVGAKWTTTRQALSSGPAAPAPASPDRGTDEARTDRRAFLATIAAASALITLTTIGQTVAPLRRLALLAPRRPDVGPQGFPINRTARTARVVDAALDPGYRLVISGAVARELALTRDELANLPQHEATLPIACVEGWSASQRWRGVQVRELLARAGVEPGATVRVESLQRRRAYRTSILEPAETKDHDTLLALEVEGEALHLDHGFPVRLIGPNRPGVLQTKWVTRLVVL
jgi:DMSO/TMAO reductase YedYZ molybdopterin-dependent catalytic subunit